MTSLRRRLRRQFPSLDLAFLTDSTIVTIGIALARVLGFGFSFVLARRLSTESFGFIQYTITLAGVVAIGTQPFVQHVLARFVAKNKEDAERLAQTLHAVWFVLLGIVGVTMVIALPILIVSGQLNIGVLIIFLGVTLFNSYYGLARGFMASRRLLAAYLGSNLVQIIAILLVYQDETTTSPTPALLIYGLSYLAPLIILQVWKPLPIRFRLAFPDRAIATELIRFSLPIWVSHTAYIFYAGMDILLLERYTDTSSVGLYALTKTLSMIFSFVPVGLITILLPKIASIPTEQHAALLKKTMLAALAANGATLIVFLVGYRWFITTFIGANYLVSMDVALMLVLAEILFGFHGIITAVLVGSNNPQLETVSRITIVLTAGVLGMLLIPRYGLSGAGLMMLCCGVVAVLTYGVAGLIQRQRRNRTALASH
ncbi:MAG: oligosaccharide flippase family protein [Chloroflexi bacterium]|nr:oligosaccharide flippase family protein [Chloroflexota bacterium]